MPLQLANKVKDNDQIQQQHADTKHRHLFNDLVEFEREQQARRHDRQIRGPGELQSQPDALRQQHPRIAQTDKPRQQHTTARIIHDGSWRNRAVATRDRRAEP